MLANLNNRPVGMVIDPLDETFMLEARSSGLCRWVDAPLVGGLELEDNSFVEEARESLFKDPFGGERPDGALFLLIAIFGAALGKGLMDM